MCLSRNKMVIRTGKKHSIETREAAPISRSSGSAAVPSSLLLGTWRWRPLPSSCTQCRILVHDMSSSRSRSRHDIPIFISPCLRMQLPLCRRPRLHQPLRTENKPHGPLVLPKPGPRRSCFNDVGDRVHPGVGAFAVGLCIWVFVEKETMAFVVFECA